MAEYRTYITGLDDCLKCFDQAPKNLLKVVKGAVSGDWSALVGAFNKVKSGTSEPDDWVKAYWKQETTKVKP